jgi:hypothetical protein
LLLEGSNDPRPDESKFAARCFSVSGLWHAFRKRTHPSTSEEQVTKPQKKKVRFAPSPSPSPSDAQRDHMFVHSLEAGFRVEKAPNGGTSSNTIESTATDMESQASTNTDDVFFDACSRVSDTPEDQVSETTLEVQGLPLPLQRQEEQTLRPAPRNPSSTCCDTLMRARVCLMQRARHKRPFSYLLTERDKLPVGAEAATYCPR